MKTTNLLKILLIVFMTGAIWSCSNEQLLDGSALGNGDASMVTFSFDTRSSGFAINNTGGSAVTEDDVLEVVVLLFEKNKDELSFYRETNKITSFTNSSDLKAFTIEIPKGNYDIYVIANANATGTLIADAGISVGNSKATIQQKLKYSGTSLLPIPMWGEVKDVNATGEYASAAVTLIRMAAKVDLLVGEAAKPNFNLQSVHLYNYYNEGYIIPGGVDSSVPTIPATATKATDAQGKPIPINYTGITLDGGRGIAIENKIYTYEAEEGSTTTPLENIALVVGGIYGDDTAPSYYRVDFTEGLGEAKELISVLRNNHYQTTIKLVGERGASTPEAAFENPPVNFETTVTRWNQADLSNVELGGQSGANGPYKLSVSQGSFAFTPQARVATSTDNKLSITTDYPTGWKVVKIVDANGNDINTASNSTTGWLKLTPNSISTVGTNLTMLELKANNGGNRKGFIHISAGRLTYVVKIEQEGLIKPEANSYIVKPNGSPLKIPVSRVNKSMLGNQLVTGDVFTAELVWTDNSNKISASSNIKSISVEGTGPTGLLVIEPGSAEGNAVVAIKNASGKILWSWHIWVTDYAPTFTGPGSFMDRNLGAMSNNPVNWIDNLGLMYQWGRKDPFPGSSATYSYSATQIFNRDKVINITQVDLSSKIANNATGYTGPNNLSNAISNPLSYYYLNWEGDAHDWFIGKDKAQNDSLWSPTTKTVFDPCPPGWRVPNNDDLKVLNNSGNFKSENGEWPTIYFGRRYINDDYGGFYPATGNAPDDNSYANLEGFNTTGGVWSSEASRVDAIVGTKNLGKLANALRFSLDPDGVVVLGTYFENNKVVTKPNNRAMGLPVRCVRE